MPLVLLWRRFPWVFECTDFYIEDLIVHEYCCRDNDQIADYQSDYVQISLFVVQVVEWEVKWDLDYLKIIEQFQYDEGVHQE